LEDTYLRNKIRNKLVPLLEKEYNPNIKELLCNMAENVGYDYDYLNRAAYDKAKNLGQRINLKKFLSLHRAMQRLVLRLNIIRVKGDTRRITFKHIKEIEDLVSYRPLNSIVDLPGDVSVIKKKNYLYFYRR
jgi:tRNA(Ile)-lysidine synthase